MKPTIEQILLMPRMYYLPAEQYNNNCIGLYEMMKEISKPDFNMVEIGCFAGVSSMLFASMCKRVMCVDPFIAYSELDKEKIDIAYNLFKNNMFLFDNIYLHQFASLYTVDFVADASLDIVYIDGAHDVESVEADLRAWMPKIKQGGWLCGHDINIDVRLAVEKVIGTDYKTYADTSWAHQIK